MYLLRFSLLTQCLLLSTTFYFGLSAEMNKTTMKALVVPHFGPPKVMLIRDVPIPKPVEKEVLVKVMAAGINPVDAYIRSGTYSEVPTTPFILGKEIAGTIEETGTGVNTYQKNARVFCGIERGGYAEYAIANATDCYPLSEKLSFSQGAALFVIYFAAYKAVIRKAHTKRNENVLIHGASGSLGTAAIQVAKTVGAYVVASVGEKHFESLMLRAGADCVIFHDKPHYMEDNIQDLNITGYNVIVEILGSSDFLYDREFLAPYGRIIVMGVRNRFTKNDTQLFSQGGVPREGAILGVSLTKSTKRQQQLAASFLMNGVETGWIKPMIAQEYTFHQASLAHHKISFTRSSKGKLVFTPWRTNYEWRDDRSNADFKSDIAIESVYNDTSA